jgi:hypothetical protein
MSPECRKAVQACWEKHNPARNAAYAATQLPVNQYVYWRICVDEAWWAERAEVIKHHQEKERT